LEADCLSRWVEASGIHFIHCVPSLFRLLNSEPVGRNVEFRDLAFILLSGERIDPGELSLWFSRFGDRVKIINLYGTSETTMAKTYYPVKAGDLVLGRVPVGKGIIGAQVLVLDQNKRICDPLVPGDLYIRTPFRTFGYVNEPELTWRRFVVNPLTGNPHDLLHKTGDRGRWLLDGNVDVLGRIDRQVKVRGIRIEPGEVENVLLRYPGVREAVVVKIELPGNNEMLCAYFSIIKSFV
ncbi:MAG: amino acid adenylation domain-containing protein, partial [bacterium]|nr:amino acid adenylation domain-containing protein [bacterium]